MHDDRQRRAIDAEAGGLHRGQLAGFLQQAEGDEHRQQHRHRRHQVNHRRAQVPQVFRHRDQRHLVAHDVGQQLEEGEDQRQHQERRHDHREIQREVAQDHVVEDQRESAR